MTETDDLSAIEPWLSGYLARLQPAQRTMLSRRIGMLMRRANAARVTANVEPDGSPMTARKPKAERRSKKGKTPRTRIRDRGQRGAMFRRIELARNMVVIPTANEVALTFKPRVAQTAAVHHFGEVAPVNPKMPNSIRVRYPQRRLLGFAPADTAEIMALALEWLDAKSR